MKHRFSIRSSRWEVGIDDKAGSAGSGAFVHGDFVFGMPDSGRFRNGHRVGMLGGETTA